MRELKQDVSSSEAKSLHGIVFHDMTCTTGMRLVEVEVKWEDVGKRWEEVP